MRRLLVPLVMVLSVGAVSTSASASTLRVRVDANDSRSNLDIHKVITNLSPTTMYLRVRSWDRFSYLSMREEWDFSLDTFGSPAVDRAVAIFPAPHGIVCVVYNLHAGAGQPGYRPAIRATRPDRRSAACHLPRSWFGHIDRAVRFRVFVFSYRKATNIDKAPGHGGVYRWI
jgi:hypothetical protein